MPKYFRDIVFIQDTEGFDEFYAILDESGEEAALEYLKQWDEGTGEVTEAESINDIVGQKDTIYQEDNYYMTYNYNVGYAGLHYELTPEEQEAYVKRFGEADYRINEYGEVKPRKIKSAIELQAWDVYTVSDEGRKKVGTVKTSKGANKEVAMDKAYFQYGSGAGGKGKYSIGFKLEVVKSGTETKASKKVKAEVQWEEVAEYKINEDDNGVVYIEDPKGGKIYPEKQQSKFMILPEEVKSAYHEHYMPEINASKKVKANEEQSDAERNKAIAQEILRQLGGNKFVAMTGARNFGFDGPSLSFAIGSGAKNKIKYVKIKLTPMDVYDMTFMDRNGNTVEQYDGVYNDQLRDLFTEATGMDTSLGTMTGSKKTQANGNGFDTEVAWIADKLANWLNTKDPKDEKELKTYIQKSPDNYDMLLEAMKGLGNGENMAKFEATFGHSKVAQANMNRKAETEVSNEGKVSKGKGSYDTAISDKKPKDHTPKTEEIGEPERESKSKKFKVGQRVYVPNKGMGEVVGLTEEDNTPRIRFDNGSGVPITVHVDDVYTEKEAEDMIESTEIKKDMNPKAAMKTKAYKEDQSDITGYAGEVMDAFSEIEERLGDRDRNATESHKEQYLEALKPFVGKLTKPDKDCLEDYNYHAALEWLNELEGKKTASKKIKAGGGAGISFEITTLNPIEFEVENRALTPSFASEEEIQNLIADVKVSGYEEGEHTVDNDAQHLFKVTSLTLELDDNDRFYKDYDTDPEYYEGQNFEIDGRYSKLHGMIWGGYVRGNPEDASITVADYVECRIGSEIYEAKLTITFEFTAAGVDWYYNEFLQQDEEEPETDIEDTEE